MAARVWPRPPATRCAFTLLEVVVAIGILAATVVGVLALQVAVEGSVGQIGARDRAVRLEPAIDVELRRLRESAVAESHIDGLGALAQRVPPNDSASALRLVGSRDGSHVVRESDADDAVLGVALRDRFYLVEVRQLAAPLAYVGGAGYLAVTVRVSWPYTVAPAPGDSAGRSAIMLNLAMAP